MHPKNVQIVVSRHEEDTAWTQRLAARGYHVAVYEHGPSAISPYVVPVNRGREASAYFRYILDHYDSLAPYTAFVHGSEASWHHAGSLADLIPARTAAGRSFGYRSLNNRCMSSILRNDKLPRVARFFKRFLEPYLAPMSRYADWTEGDECCAQFVVHRSRITRYPKAFYQDIYTKFLLADGPTTTTAVSKEEDKLAGHMLEWTFNLIYNNPFLDQRLTPEQHARRQRERAGRDSATCRKIT